MAYNQSIFEQISGTLGSEYAQTVGMLARDKDKRSKKERNQKLLGSILFSGLTEGAKQFKIGIEDKIKTLSEQSVWDTNYTKELWQQGTQIKAIDAEYRKNPSYFYKIAADSIMDSPIGADIARAGGVNNLPPAAYKVYKDLIKARETEHVKNHQIRMQNPTADISTFKEFSEADRNMLVTQTNNLKNDPANRSWVFAGLRKLGVGKDKEIEFQGEVEANLKEQQKRWEAAEAYIAPLDVTKFIDYDVKNKEAFFTIGSTLDLRNSDAEKTRVRKEMADPDNNVWQNITFTDNIGMYDINNVPLDKLKDSGTKRYGGTPLKITELNNMELYTRAGTNEKGDLRFEKSNTIQGPIPYLIDDMYALERRIHAMQTSEVKKGTRETVDNLENRYAIAIQQLVESGNIRINRNWWSNNYVYIPANSSMSPIDLSNSETPNGKGSQVDTLATVHKQTEIANGQDFEKVYSKYLADRTDAANISGNIEELEFLESIKGVESKASEEARLIFMINPPKELAGTMLTFGDSNNKQGVVIGSQNENYNYWYELFKNNADTNYGPSEAIEKLLNSKDSKDLKDLKDSTKEDTIKVPEPVISEDLNPKTPGDIYYNNESDKSPASLLTQSLFNRPVRTITNIDEVLNKIDTVDSVKDLKVSDSKIIRAVRDAYKEDTGDKGILNINDLSLEDYKKYLTMYRSEFIAENQDLFKESQPKSLLAGN